MYIVSMRLCYLMHGLLYVPTLKGTKTITWKGPWNHDGLNLHLFSCGTGDMNLANIVISMGFQAPNGIPMLKRRSTLISLTSYITA